MKPLTDNIKKNAPQICTIGGIIGTIAVGILSSWAMWKTRNKIDQIKEEGEEVTPKAIIKAAAPYYIPTAGVAVASSIMSYKGYKIGQQRTAAALTLAYLSKEALERHKQKVAEMYGDKIEADIEHDAENEHLKKVAHVDDSVRMDKLNPNELWFVETFSGHVFRSTPEEIKHIESKLNYEFKATDWLSMNDVLYYFDAQPWECGEYLGWNEGSKIEFRIDHDERNAVELDIGGIKIKAIKVYLEGWWYRFNSFGDTMHY